jgi:hypothetical protein
MSRIAWAGWKWMAAWLGGVACVAAGVSWAEVPPVPAEAAELKPIRFAVIGDFGLDGWKPKSNPDDGTKPHERRNPNQAAVADLVASWKPDFVVTTGDNNYPKGEAATIDANVGKYYAAFIGNYKGSHGPGAAANRFFPVLGNHDWDAPGVRCQPYLDYFTLPGNERYYDFVWGPVHFIMLDNDGREPDGVKRGSKQEGWYREVVQASRSPFQVVVAHHPPYSSGEHGGNDHADWGFHDHGVELMLAGHDHNYERIERGDTLYVINGAGGANVRRMKETVAGSKSRFTGKHGAMRVDVVPTEGEPGTWTLTSRFLAVDGTEADVFSITRPAR